MVLAAERAGLPDGDRGYRTGGATVGTIGPGEGTGRPDVAARLPDALEQRELIGVGGAAAGAAGFWRLGALEGDARPVGQLG